MIARIWRGRAASPDAHRYERHALDTVFPALSANPGHRGAVLLKRDTEGETEFLVLTLWSGMDAVAAFAGSDIDAAVVEPEAHAALTEFDDFVRHFDVVRWAGPVPGG